ncbi:MAG TPA: DUF29 domain-containing protein [Xanthobacteraceae bacterium]|jgi:hypothetical protein|nr:DUF29 domain-containing protein [Xanthobacteraceae bacterium]
MASRTTGHVLGPPTAPDKPTRADYDTDFYSWSIEQARLLRESDWTQVDRENVAEEIESLGREQFNKLESAFRVLLLHILKWDYQPGRRSRSWIISIKQQRLEVDDVLADNPGLRPRIAEAIGRAYRKARLEAAKETDLEESAFPDACGYGFDDIMTRDFVL